MGKPTGFIELGREPPKRRPTKARIKDFREFYRPWPEPQMVSQIQGPLGAVYGVADILDCLEGKLDEPKNSGRRVAVALEVEIVLKQSAVQGGVRVDLPLEDRSLRLNYDWYR